MSRSESPIYNELAQYFEYSPNALVSGCLNTGQNSDGVVFPGIEPQEDAHCFVGRDSIVSAVAVLYGMTPYDVLLALSEDQQDLNDHVATLSRELKAAHAKLDKAKKALGG